MRNLSVREDESSLNDSPEGGKIQEMARNVSTKKKKRKKERKQSTV